MNHGYKPMTNADRIRAMTAEELAEVFHKVSCCCCGDNCEGCYFQESPFCNDEDDMLAWLRQPVKEGAE